MPTFGTAKLYICSPYLSSWQEQESSCLLSLFEKVSKATRCFILSVCPSSRNSSPPNGRFFMKFDIEVFLENRSIEFMSCFDLRRITCSLHGLCTFTIIYGWISLTYLLTPWCRVLLEKLTGLQPVKKFPAFYGTRRFITALTSVRHLSLSWASPSIYIYIYFLLLCICIYIYIYNIYVHLLHGAESFLRS